MIIDEVLTPLQQYVNWKDHYTMIDEGNYLTSRTIHTGIHIRETTTNVTPDLIRAYEESIRLWVASGCNKAFSIPTDYQSGPSCRGRYVVVTSTLQVCILLSIICHATGMHRGNIIPNVLFDVRRLYSTTVEHYNTVLTLRTYWTYWTSVLNVLNVIIYGTFLHEQTPRL